MKARPVVTSVSQATRPDRVVAEHRVEDRVGDLVGDLVGVSFRHRLGGKEVPACLEHGIDSFDAVGDSSSGSREPSTSGRVASTHPEEKEHVTTVGPALRQATSPRIRRARRARILLEHERVRRPRAGSRHRPSSLRLERGRRREGRRRRGRTARPGAARSATAAAAPSREDDDLVRRRSDALESCGAAARHPARRGRRPARRVTRLRSRRRRCPHRGRGRALPTMRSPRMSKSASRAREEVGRARRSGLEAAGPSTVRRARELRGPLIGAARAARTESAALRS